MPDRRSFQFPKMRTFLRRILILALFLFGDPTPESLITGAVLIVIGQMLHFVAAGTLVKTDVLTIAGPYRFVRNPFYVANVLIDAGFCVIAWNPYIAAAWFIVFYGFVIIPRVKSEEAELLRIHGKAYQDYMDKVPRYFPSPYPRYPHTRGAFSFEALHHNREIPRAMRHIAFILLFFCKDRMIDMQGGNKWSVKAFPSLTHGGVNAFVFWSGVALIVLPWVHKAIRKMLFPKEKPGPPAGAANAPEAQKAAP